MTCPACGRDVAIVRGRIERHDRIAALPSSTCGASGLTPGHATISFYGAVQRRARRRG